MEEAQKKKKMEEEKKKKEEELRKKMEEEKKLKLLEEERKKKELEAQKKRDLEEMRIKKEKERKLKLEEEEKRKKLEEEKKLKLLEEAQKKKDLEELRIKKEEEQKLKFEEAEKRKKDEMAQKTDNDTNKIETELTGDEIEDILDEIEENENKQIVEQENTMNHSENAEIAENKVKETEDYKNDENVVQNEQKLVSPQSGHQRMKTPPPMRQLPTLPNIEKPVSIKTAPQNVDKYKVATPTTFQQKKAMKVEKTEKKWIVKTVPNKSPTTKPSVKSPLPNTPKPARPKFDPNRLELLSPTQLRTLLIKQKRERQEQQKSADFDNLSPEQMRELLMKQKKLIQEQDNKIIRQQQALKQRKNGTVQ